MNIKTMFLAMLVLILAGCSLAGYHDTGMPVSVTLGLGLPVGRAPDESAYEWTSLQISGPGMQTISLGEQELYALFLLSQGESATILVPSGQARTFKLAGTTGTADFSGSATVDLPEEGEIPPVAIPMALDSVRILVADTYNNRIVQLNDMQGNGRTESDSFTLIDPPLFEPIAVDIDSNGYIYTLARDNDYLYHVIRAPALTSDAVTWTEFLNLNTYAYNPVQMKIRRTDNTAFILYSPEGYTIFPIQQDSTSGNEYGVTGQAFDFDILDSGEIALFTYSYTLAGYVLSIINYNADNDQWETIASIESTDVDVVGYFSRITEISEGDYKPVLTHKGNSIYVTGINSDNGALQLHQVDFNEGILTAYKPSDTEMSTEWSELRIHSVVPSFDNSFIFRVSYYDNGIARNVSTLLHFDFDDDELDNLVFFDGGEDFFSFNYMQQAQ